jgi:hypothetical protein
MNTIFLAFYMSFVLPAMTAPETPHYRIKVVAKTRSETFILPSAIAHNVTLTLSK